MNETLKLHNAKGERKMRIAGLLQTAIMTTGLVLLTVWALNKFPATRNIVQKALA